MDRTTRYYQVVGGITEHVKAKVNAILEATTEVEAAKRYKKAIDSGFMTCLAAWSKGDAKGPRTKKWLLKEAQKEDAFTDRLLAKGFKLAAKKHKKMAEDLWDEFHSMG